MPSPGMTVMSLRPSSNVHLLAGFRGDQGHGFTSGGGIAPLHYTTGLEAL